MRPRRFRPMIVGVPLEPGVGGMGGEYDIDAEGVDGGGPDPIGDAHRPHRRHLDPARRGARRGRFSSPPLMIRRRGLGGRICHPSWTRPRNTPYFNDPKTPGNRGLKAI